MSRERERVDAMNVSQFNFFDSLNDILSMMSTGSAWAKLVGAKRVDATAKAVDAGHGVHTDAERSRGHSMREAVTMIEDTPSLRVAMDSLRSESGYSVASSVALDSESAGHSVEHGESGRSIGLAEVACYARCVREAGADTGHSIDVIIPLVLTALSCHFGGLLEGAKPTAYTVTEDEGSGVKTHVISISLPGLLGKSLDLTLSNNRPWLPAHIDQFVSLTTAIFLFQQEIQPAFSLSRSVSRGGLGLRDFQFLKEGFPCVVNETDAHGYVVMRAGERASKSFNLNRGGDVLNPVLMPEADALPSNYYFSLTCMLLRFLQEGAMKKSVFLSFFRLGKAEIAADLANLSRARLFAEAGALRTALVDRMTALELNEEEQETVLSCLPAASASASALVGMAARGAVVTGAAAGSGAAAAGDDAAAGSVVSLSGRKVA